MSQTHQKEAGQDNDWCREQDHRRPNPSPNLSFDFPSAPDRSQPLDPRQQGEHPQHKQKQQNWKREDHSSVNRATISDESGVARDGVPGAEWRGDSAMPEAEIRSTRPGIAAPALALLA